MAQYIVQEFGLPEDEETLQRCSLVSKSFRFAAQRLLFQQAAIILNPVTRLQKCRLRILSKILNVSPGIGSYIRNLTLFIRADRRPQATAACLNCLEMMPAVKCLSLASKGDSVDWPAFDDLLQSCLLNRLRSLPLTKLSLRGIKKIPILELSHSRDLRALDLDLGGFETEFTSQPPEVSNAPGTVLLRKLNLSANSPALIEETFKILFLAGQTPMSLDALEEIRVSYNSGGFGDPLPLLRLQDVIDHSLPCKLKKIELRSWDRLAGYLNLSSATQLRSIAFSVWDLCDRSNSAVLDALRTLPIINSLEKLSISLSGIIHNDQRLIALGRELSLLDKYGDCAIHLDLRKGLNTELMLTLTQTLRTIVLRPTFTLECRLIPIDLSEIRSQIQRREFGE